MISLYGGLARKFKTKYPGIDPKKIPCKVKSVAEALRAMESQFKGFTSLIRRRGYYKVVRGNNIMNDNKLVSKEEAEVKYEEDTWHFMPVAAGAGKAGKFILGAVIVVIAVVVMIYFPYLSFFAGFALGFGLNMMMDAAGLLPEPPETPKGNRDDTPSYLFDGAVNISDPGAVVPVAYGETFVGSIVASFGIKTEAYA